MADMQALRDFFQTRGHKHSHKKGQILIRPGVEPQGIYFIANGLVKVYSLSHDSVEHDHLYYGPNDIFPIIWAIEGSHRSVFYETMEDTDVWLVSKADFVAFVESNPTVTYQLLQRTTEFFKLYGAQIDNLLYSNSSERIAFKLLALLHRYHERSGSDLVLSINLTNQDIAYSVATTRETVNRFLARLKRQGILDYDVERKIIIKDVERLAKLIGLETAQDMWPDLLGPAPTTKA